MDLPKPFDCLQYNLLLAKINAYGFDYKPLKLIPSYLNNRKYRTKINSSFSKWKHLFIDISFLFMSEANVASYVVIRLYMRVKKNLHDVQRKLESESLILFELFHDNYLKANSGKSQVMLTTGVIVDNKLYFEPHLNLACKKVSQKLHTFARVSKFISKIKLKVIMKTFLKSHFGCCPFVWMCYGTTFNSKINKLHQRTLRLVYDHRQSIFEELLNIDKSVTINHKNLQVLATELYKVHHRLAPELTKDIFKKRM